MGFRREILPHQLTDGRSVGRSDRRRSGSKWNSNMGSLRLLIPPHRPTDGPTVGLSVGRTVGDLGGGEIHIGVLSEAWEKVMLVTNGTVGWSVGRKIGEVNKPNERKQDRRLVGWSEDWWSGHTNWLKDNAGTGTWEVRTKGEIDPQVTYSGCPFLLSDVILRPSPDIFTPI